MKQLLIILGLVLVAIIGVGTYISTGIDDIVEVQSLSTVEDNAKVKTYNPQQTVPAKTLKGATPTPTPVVTPVPKPEATMTSLTNDYRASQGLNTLAYNALLTQSAQMKADDLCTDNYWAHVASDGTTAWDLIKAVGYYYSKAGENLAKSFRTVQDAFTGLVNSPTHLENIVGDYNDIGVGFNACGGKNYYAIHYGRL